MNHLQPTQKFIPQIGSSPPDMHFFKGTHRKSRFETTQKKPDVTLIPHLADEEAWRRRRPRRDLAVWVNNGFKVKVS